MRRAGVEVRCFNPLRLSSPLGWVHRDHRKSLLVDGRAAIVSLPEAMDGLVEYYRRVAGEHPDWGDYRAAMERERRVLLRISVDRVGPNQSG